MGPQRRGQELLLVQVDEDERRPPARLADGTHALVSWSARHRASAAGLAVAAVLVLVWLVVMVPRVVSERERRDVLGAGAFTDAVRSLRQAPREVWRVPARAGFTPVLAGDAVVVSSDGRILDAVDVVTGDVRWTRAVAPQGATVRDCVTTDDRLVCLVGASGRRTVTATHVVALAPTTGEVLLDTDVPGAWVAMGADGGDVLLAGWPLDEVAIAVVRLDGDTGAERWRASSDSGVGLREARNLDLAVAGQVVLATAVPARLVLDARDGRSLDGERSPAAAPTSQDDAVRLRPDGTVVGIRYHLHDGIVGARSVLRDGTGRRLALVDGEAVSPAVVDDAGIHRVLTVERGNGVLMLRAYERPWGTDATWTTVEPDAQVVADAGDRVVLVRTTSLVGLDAATGTRVWQRPVEAVAGDGPAAVFCDGHRIALMVREADGSPALAAFSLADGDLSWQVGLPAGTVRVVRAGSQLYALTADSLVALR